MSNANMNNSEPCCANGKNSLRAVKVTPRADIVEQTDAFVVYADIPGVDEKTLDVHVDKNVLTISGRPEVVEPEGYRKVLQGYSQGEYRRTFTLDSDIDVGAIEASVKHGVLSVRLPKSPKAQPRKIPVRAVN